MYRTNNFKAEYVKFGDGMMVVWVAWKMPKRNDLVWLDKFEKFMSLVSSLIFCGFPLDLISSHTAQLHIFTFQLREKVKGGNEGNTGAIVE